MMITKPYDNSSWFLWLNDTHIKQLLLIWLKKWPICLFFQNKDLKNLLEKKQYESYVSFSRVLSMVFPNRDGVKKGTFRGQNWGGGGDNTRFVLFKRESVCVFYFVLLAISFIQLQKWDKNGWANCSPHISSLSF